MTKEYEEGMHARSIGLHLINNPYSVIFDKKYKDWTNGWKLENWRLLSNAKREEVNRQIQTNRNIRRDAESYRG